MLNFEFNKQKKRTKYT